MADRRRVRKLVTKHAIDFATGLIRSRYKLALREAARLWRPFLDDVTFVGITGSAGKTTTKELILAILSRRLRGVGSHATENRPTHVARTVLKTRPWHDFSVVELSASRPGAIDRSLAMVRPRVGVVTAVRDDHVNAYGSRAALAAEKGKLIGCLPIDGTAVLNADDDLVIAMRARCTGRVITYGLTSEADVRAESISATWPARLRFTVVVGSERMLLQTQLAGTQWTPSVLAAVATGLGLGIPLDGCVSAIAATRPFLARMEPVIDARGVTFMRDDWKAPLWTTDAAFGFMRDARAPRKVIVVGTLSDYGGDASAQYARVAERAAAVADHVVFVGPWASRVLRIRARNPGCDLRAFSTVRQACDYLDGMLRAGDLVLLKGTNRQNHLVRLILARTDEVRCWRDDCDLNIFCTACGELSVPSGAAVTAAASGTDAQDDGGREPVPHAGLQVVISLGNPGSRFAGTPHSIGHDVLDRLGQKLGAHWIRHETASMARVRSNDRELFIVKLETPVNRSGLAVKRLADRFGFAPEDCILVHDDVDLPLGTVRVRMRGSAGGHRGVASILDVVQTDAVRRVKLGVGRPDEQTKVAEYVLKPFPDADRPQMDRACAVAVDRVLELIAKASPRGGE